MGTDNINLNRLADGSRMIWRHHHHHQPAVDDDQKSSNSDLGDANIPNKCPPSSRRRGAAAVVNLSTTCRLNNWPAYSSTRNSAAVIARGGFANCDNYNPMCQLYESINSREKVPIIKRSQLWNTQNSQINYSQFIIRTLIGLLLLCPSGCRSWTAVSSRDPARHHPQSFDYSDDVPFLFNSLPDRDPHDSGPPVFGKTPRTIEGTVGQTVILSCIVHNLGAKRVTWMRMRDLQILTHGPLLFTSDGRVSSERPYGDHSSWGLVISDLRVEDSGKYECQVNSDPELKQEVELVVREQQQSDMPFVPAGRTTIDGPREEVVKTGTVVVLNCSARHQFNLSGSSGEQLQPVVWLKDGNPIDKFETARGGVNVMTDWRPSTVTSRLTLITASSSDNGVYSCTVPGSGTDKVTLFIDEVEAQANTKARNGSQRSFSNSLVLLFCTALTLLN